MTPENIYMMLECSFDAIKWGLIPFGVHFAPFWVILKQVTENDPNMGPNIAQVVPAGCTVGPGGDAVRTWYGRGAESDGTGVTLYDCFSLFQHILTGFDLVYTPYHHFLFPFLLPPYELREISSRFPYFAKILQFFGKSFKTFGRFARV